MDDEIDSRISTDMTAEYGVSALSERALRCWALASRRVRVRGSAELYPYKCTSLDLTLFIPRLDILWRARLTRRHRVAGSARPPSQRTTVRAAKPSAALLLGCGAGLRRCSGLDGPTNAPLHPSGGRYRPPVARPQPFCHPRTNRRLKHFSARGRSEVRGGGARLRHFHNTCTVWRTQ
eukprot:COSAG02_NODE_3259_length_7079_cov_30.942693_4_plen_178_part_00